MSAKGKRGGRRGSGQSQRELGLNPRALRGPSEPAPYRPVSIEQGPFAREWAPAIANCRLCGLPVILAVSRLGRTMRVDPYQRTGGPVRLLPRPGEDHPERPLAVVSGHELAGMAFAHHGGSCAAKRLSAGRLEPYTP